MKNFSLLITSILVGLVSVLVFKQRLLEIATELAHTYSVYYSYFSGATTPDTTQSLRTDSQHHLFATDMSVSRAIRKVVLAVEQAEGAGARVRRSIGGPSLRNLSPFLMLDHFSSNSAAGFPDQ